VPEHVHGGLALLQRDVAHEGRVAAFLWLHVQEEHLARDGLETFESDLDRPANAAPGQLLGRRFDLDLPDDGKVPQPILSTRASQERDLSGSSKLSSQTRVDDTTQRWTPRTILTMEPLTLLTG